MRPYCIFVGGLFIGTAITQMYLGWDDSVRSAAFLIAGSILSIAPKD